MDQNVTFWEVRLNKLLGIFKAPEACEDRKEEQRPVFHGRLILKYRLGARMRSSSKIRESLGF